MRGSGEGDEEGDARAAATAAAAAAHASAVVEEALSALAAAGCVVLGPGEGPDAPIASTPLGRVASKFCLRQGTARLLGSAIQGAGAAAPPTAPSAAATLRSLLRLLVTAPELADVPVRHGEEGLNAGLAGRVPWGGDAAAPGLASPAAKASLLAQAHFGRVPPPIADYTTDARGALDALGRLGGAALAVAVERGAAREAVAALALSQCLAAGAWPDDPPALQLPGLPRDRGGATAAAAAVMAAAGAGGYRSLVGPGGAAAAASALAAARLPPAGAAAAGEALRSRFPAVDLGWELRAEGEVEKGEDGGSPSFALEVRLARPGPGGHPPSQPATPGVPVRAFAPRSVAAKEEGWWVLAVEGTGVLSAADGAPSPRLLGAARVTGLAPGRVATARLALSSPLPFTLLLASDCYLGLDVGAVVEGPGRGGGGVVAWSAAAAAAG